MLQLIILEMYEVNERIEIENFSMSPFFFFCVGMLSVHKAACL